MQASQIESKSGVYFVTGSATGSPNQSDTPPSNPTGAAGNEDWSQQISGMAALIGDGKINVEYENTTYGVIIKNNQIQETKAGILYPDAKGTLKVSTSAINAIVAAQDRVKEAKNQLNNGGIQYIPHDIVETIKFFFVKLFASFS
jgi:hypothetical protein